MPFRKVIFSGALFIFMLLFPWTTEAKTRGRFINNKEMAYPILEFRGIDYLPLTWEMVTEVLGWSSAFEPAAGLAIDSMDPLRPIFNDEIIAMQFAGGAAIQASMEYGYNDNGYLGYRPGMVGVPDDHSVERKDMT